MICLEQKCGGNCRFNLQFNSSVRALWSSQWLEQQRDQALCIWHPRSSNRWLVQQKAGETRYSLMGGDRDDDSFWRTKVIRLGLMVIHSIHYYPWRRSLLYSPLEMVNTAIVTAPSVPGSQGKQIHLTTLFSASVPGCFFWSCILSSPRPSILILLLLCFTCSFVLSSLQYPIQFIPFIGWVSQWL